MKITTYDTWEQIPFSFQFPYACIWFLSPDGYIDGYFLDYGSFRPVNEQVLKGKIPFRLFRADGDDY